MLMVYDTRAFHLCGDERSESRGRTWRTLDAAKEACQSEMKYDPEITEDRPTWFDAVGVVSSLTGRKGTTYARIYHLTVQES